ncbi:MAG: DUF4330 family protein [Clostridia bacterium]|nr:DUF4330 family protein [Clostridia bacterium]
MNTKNNDKPHFNIADVIIIIVIVAMITALGLRIYNVFGRDTQTDKIRIEFRVTGISGDSISLKEEAKLYSVADDSYVGYLEEFEVADTVQYAYNKNGELVKATVPGKKTVTGTLVINCTKTEKGFYLGGTKLLSEGSTLALYTATRELEFEIVKITEITKDSENSNTAKTTAGTTAVSSTSATTASVN